MLVGFLGMLLGVGLLAPLLQVEFERGVGGIANLPAAEPLACSGDVSV